MEYEKLDANEVETERENKNYKLGQSSANKSLSISDGPEEWNQETSPFMMNYEDHQDIPENNQSTEGHSTPQVKEESQIGTYAESLTNMLMVTSVLQSAYNKSAGEEQTGFDLSGTGILIPTAISGEVPDQMPCWPFEKKSCIWNVIDSIEEISIMKKRPHFQPLKECPWLFREGMAVGFFWTYIKLFRSIVGTKIEDSSPHYDGKMGDSSLNFDEKMEALMVLKCHGFDVKHLQVRLQEMMKSKNEHQQSLEEIAAQEVLIPDKEKAENEDCFRVP